MEDYEDEDEVLIEIEPEDSNFVEEEVVVATCMVQQLLCNQKNPDTTQGPLDFLLKVFDNEQGVQSHHRQL